MSVLKRSDGSKGGRPPYDPVLMFKILVLQTLYTLSDDATEFQIRDRLSFMRFLDLGFEEAVPDAKTVWLFREQLTRTSAIDDLFAAFDGWLKGKSYLAMAGQIMDASIIAAPRRTGVSAYIGDGQNRWPAVHVSDAGRLYRLALESGANEHAYHGVGKEGIAFRTIAEAIGRKLGLPVEARDADHFGWFAGFAASDMPASSARTGQVLGWQPTGPGLLADIGQPDYYAAT